MDGIEWLCGLDRWGGWGSVIVGGGWVRVDVWVAGVYSAGGGWS